MLLNILYGEEAVSFCTLCQQLTCLAAVCCHFFRMQAVLCAAALQDDSGMNTLGTSADDMGMSKEDVANKNSDVTVHPCHPTHNNQIWQVRDLLSSILITQFTSKGGNLRPIGWRLFQNAYRDTVRCD